MADLLKRVFVGDRFKPSADSWNAITEAAQDYLRKKALGQGAGPNFPPGPATVKVRNVTGGGVPWFGVLSLAGQDPVIDAGANLPGFQQQVVIDGDAPAAAGETFVVLLEAIPDGAIGEAAVAGLVQVQVQVSDAGHGYATTATGDVDKLASQAAADGGVPIIWKESGTGTKWALVLLPVAHAITTGGGGTTIYKGFPKFEAAPDEGDVLVGQSIPNNMWTTITFDDLATDAPDYFDSPSEDVLVAPVAGNYVWGVSVGFANGAGTYRGVSARAGGGSAEIATQVSKVLTPVGSGSVLSISVSAAYPGAESYPFRFAVYQDSGGALDLLFAYGWIFNLA